jgi:MFS family permease
VTGVPVRKHGEHVAPAGAPFVVTPEARRARWAVSTVFFLTGVGVANWSVRIPAVQERLGLGEGQLGLALLGVSAGALSAMPLSGRLVARYGSRPVTAWSIALFALAVALPARATSLALLAAALFAMGLTNGLLDVSMNSQAAAVARRYPRPVMSGVHAMYSFGGLVGAAMGGRVAASGVDPVVHLGWVALGLVIVACLASPGMLPAAADAAPEQRARVRATRPLLVIGLVAFCCLFGEGAMGNWSAVYLRNVSGAGPGLAAAGFAAFSLCMAAGRAVGDTLTMRLGPARLVRAGASLATLGIGAALVVPHPWVVIVGFGAVGAGLAATFPLTLAAASRTPGVVPGTAIAVVSMCGYSGLLAGPPFIGSVASVITLRGGLALVFVSCVLIVALSRVVRDVPASGVVRDAAVSPSPASSRPTPQPASTSHPDAAAREPRRAAT